MNSTIGRAHMLDVPINCYAWYAEAQRAALLLESLAEDHFPSQAAFDDWLERQAAMALRRGPATPQEGDSGEHGNTNG